MLPFKRSDSIFIVMSKSRTFPILFLVTRTMKGTSNNIVLHIQNKIIVMMKKNFITMWLVFRQKLQSNISTSFRALS